MTQPFFTGLDNMKKATSGGELKLGDKEKVIIKFLDDADGEHPIAQYYNHYVPGVGSFPCVDGIYDHCPLCEAGVKRIYRMLANVAVVDKDGAVVNFIRKGREFVSECLTTYLDEYGTLTDRYYKIIGDSRTMGDTNYVAFKMIPTELPKDYKEVDESELRRIDWSTFLITPKLEELERVANDLRK